MTARTLSPSPESVAESLGLAVLESVRMGGREPVEVLKAADGYCETCRRAVLRGEVAWKWTRHTNAGGWRDVVNCADCPCPYQPASPVDAGRLIAWNLRNQRVTRTGARGRPQIHMSPSDVALVRELRDVQGLGEGRLAEAFTESTGRRISARTLSKYGR